MLTTRAMAGDTLSGAGSTLVAPILAEWAAAFQAFHGTVVRYDPVGSQAEIRDISSRTVDFAASDAPLTPAEASVCQSCYQIPWSLSAIGIGYHVGGIGSTLRLTGGVLAEIYLGQISRWNDSRIKALNPRTPLPALRITPIYTGTSGDTYTFTSYLSKVSTAWRTKVGYGLTVTFPTGVPANSRWSTQEVLLQPARIDHTCRPRRFDPPQSAPVLRGISAESWLYGRSLMFRLTGRLSRSRPERHGTRSSVSTRPKVTATAYSWGFGS